MVYVLKITSLKGEKALGTSFKNLYILHRGAKGELIINDHDHIDISQIDLLENYGITKIKWNFEDLGIWNAVYLFLSNSYMKIKDMIVLVKDLTTPDLLIYDIGTVGAGLTATTIIPPSAGYVYEVKGVSFKFGTGTPPTTGSYYLGIYSLYNGKTFFYLKTQRDYTKPLIIEANIVSGGAVIEEKPSTELGQMLALSNILVTPDVPLYIEFQNNTDADALNTTLILNIIKRQAVT